MGWDGLFVAHKENFSSTFLGEQLQVEMIVQYFLGIKWSSSKSFRQAKAAIGGCVCCMVMHGQYGLLHAPFISACGIAWGLHLKQNRMYICKTIFFSRRFFSFLRTCT